MVKGPGKGGSNQSTVLDTTWEQRVVLNPCRWETYEALLREHEDRSSPRFTFSEGMLEIMSPSAEHEELAHALETIVQAACERFEVPFRPLRSTTQRRSDLQKGAEPDASFMFEEIGRDPNVHAPDLAIEVEISRSALDKLAIFSELGVSEVWRCSPTGVQLYRLQAGRYHPADRSAFLPLTRDWLDERLVAKRSLDWLAWLRALRTELASLDSSTS